MNTSLVYSVDEAVDVAKVSRTYLYGAIRRGELPIVKKGRRTLIRCCALEDWLERSESVQTTCEAAE